MTKSSYEFGGILNEYVFTPRISPYQKKPTRCKSVLDGQVPPGEDPEVGGAGSEIWSFRSLHRWSNGRKTGSQSQPLHFQVRSLNENEELGARALQLRTSQPPLPSASPRRRRVRESPPELGA